MTARKSRPENWWPSNCYVPWSEWLARRPTWRDKNPPIGQCAGCGRPAVTVYEHVVLHPCCEAPPRRPPPNKAEYLRRPAPSHHTNHQEML